jgi:THO complex subunit 1 transcription elongation factor
MDPSPEEKLLADASKANHAWRALRIASKSSLNKFNRLDDGMNLDGLSAANNADHEESNENTKAAEDEGEVAEKSTDKSFKHESVPPPTEMDIESQESEGQDASLRSPVHQQNQIPVDKDA